MNSYTFMGIDLDREEEVPSRKKTFIKRAIAFIKNRRRANRVTRNHITRDRYGAHDRLVAAFFSDEPMYDEVKFWKTFRMARPLFNEIVTAVIDHDPFFRNNFDCTGKEGISGLLKCTSAIRSGYQQKDRKPSQNDKTEHGMEKTVKNQGQRPKKSKSKSIQKNQQSNRSRN
ncbi:hypothetical protein Tco_1008442 [Tanacetum coccineum]